MKMLIPLLVLLFASISFAAITDYNLTAIEDTYTSYPNDDTASCGASGNISVSHGTEGYMYPLCNGAFRSSWHIMLKFNMTEPMNKIITYANMSVWRNVTQCPNRVISVFASQNNTWSETDVVQTLSNFGTVITNFDTGSTQSWRGKEVNLSSAAAMNALYNASSSGIVAFQSANDGLACASAGDKIFLETKESGRPARFDFQTADYMSGSSTFTFGGSRTAYFDFESQTGSFSNFPEADFSYNIDTNTLTPLHGIQARETTSEYDIVNNLNSQTCSSVTNYGTSGISSINFPAGNYWNICFALSAQHSGRNFYGAIKVINNTNNLFTYYWALYSPSYVTFSSFTAEPSSPRGTDDVMIEWTTTLDTQGYLRLFYTYGINATSPIATVYDIDYPNLTSEHVAVIENVAAFSSYYLKLFGNTADNTTYATENYTYAFTTGSNIGVPSVEDYFDNANYSDAVVVIPMNEQGYPVGIQLTCNWISPSGSQTGFQAANVNYLVESQQLTAAAWVLFLGQSNIGETWNISCKSDGFYVTTNLSILVDELPKVLQLEMGDAPRCDAVLYTPSQTDCGLNMNASAVNAWYCRFDTNRCSVFNVNGSCLQYGTWIGYGCDSCSVIPTGFTCNGTASIGQQVNGSADISTGIGDQVGGLFGVPSESGLAFLAMIMSIILTFAAGIMTRNGIVTGMVFVGGLVMFFFVGWLPIWIPIILGVIASFMIAKFIISSASPQGSGD